MYFTLFSLAMLTVCLVSAGIGAFKGYRQGTLKSLLFLVADIAATILSILLSRLLSKLISLPVQNLFEVSGSELVAELFAMVIQILVGSILFLLLFLALRPLARLAVRIVLRVKLNGGGTEISRSDSFGGVFVGVISGILVAAALTSPITGTLNLANDAITALKLIDEDLPQKIGLDEEEAESIERFAHDIPASFCYRLGGKLIYSETAVGELDGHTVRIVKEVEAAKTLASGFRGFAPALNGSGAVNMDEIDTEEICRGIESSDVFKIIAAEFMSGASESWLSGEKFLGIGRPDFGATFNPLIDEVLIVTSTVTDECVVDDMSTLLNLLKILMDSGVLTNSESFTIDDYAALAEALTAELEKNPRMLGIKESLWGIAVGTAFDELTSSLDDEEMGSLMSELATYLNRINNSDSYTYEQKIENLTADLNEALQKYQITLPDSVSSLTAEMIIAEYDLFDGTVTAEELEEILRKYAK